MSLRAAVELPTAFSSTHEETDSGYTVTKEGLVTAFSVALILPEHKHIKLAVVDDFVKRIFDAYDKDARGVIDYRELFCGLAHMRTDLLLPVEAYLRAAYRAFDGDGNGGLTIDEFTRVILSVCATDAEVFIVRAMLAEYLEDLLQRKPPDYTNRSAAATERLKRRAELASSQTTRAGESQDVDAAAEPGPTPAPSSPVSLVPADAVVDATTRNAEDSAEFADALDLFGTTRKKAVPMGDSSRIQLAQMLRWSEDHPELRKTLQELRVLHSHAKLRERYETQIALQNQLNAMWRRDRMLASKAIAHHNAYRKKRVLYCVKLHAMREIGARMRALRDSCRRAVRRWHRFVPASQEERALQLIAYNSWRVHTLRCNFQSWVEWLRIMRQQNRAQWRRAVAFRDACLMRTLLDQWQEEGRTRRARAHYHRKWKLTCVAAWKQFTKMQAAFKGKDTSVIDQYKANMELLEARARAREAAAVLAEQAAAQEEFVRLAEEQAHAAEWKKQRALAAKRSKDRAKLEAQAAARARAARARKDARMEAFNSHWDEKIRNAMEESRQKQLQFLLSPMGQKQLQEESRNVLLAENLAAAFQEESEFRAYVDMSDGCIHFLRPGNLDVEPPIPPTDFNIDNMSYIDAREVALCHASARKACKVRDELSQIRKNEASIFERSYAATVVAQGVRRIQLRQRILDELKQRLELLADPISGAMYIYDIETGLTFDAPMRLFRKTKMHFYPDWAARASTDGVLFYHTVKKYEPDVKYGVIANARSAMERHLYVARQLDAPPPDYLMCAACAVDFATRRCNGDECNGYLYCFSCFATYHPLEDERYTSHWDRKAWQRLYVRPGGVLTEDEQASLVPRPVPRSSYGYKAPDRAVGEEDGDSDDEGRGEAGIGRTLSSTSRRLFDFTGRALGGSMKTFMKSMRSMTGSGASGGTPTAPVAELVSPTNDSATADSND